MYLNTLQAAFVIFTTIKNLNLIKSPKFLRRNGQHFEKAFLQTPWSGVHYTDWAIPTPRYLPYTITNMFLSKSASSNSNCMA